MNQKVIEHLFYSFSNLFGMFQESSVVGNPHMEERVDPHSLEDILTKELKKAVLDLPSDKAPGLSGFTSFFYQRHCLQLQEDAF